MGSCVFSVRLAMFHLEITLWITIKNGTGGVTMKVFR
jgi:hypothetical protein